MAFSIVTSPPSQANLTNTNPSPPNKAQMAVDFGKVYTGLQQLDEALQKAVGTPADLLAVSGLRNLVINGNWSINQRGYVSATALTAGVYAHDRWKAGGGGCTYSYATGGLDTVATISAGTLVQVVEGALVEGGTYTLSWAGTAQARIDSGSYAASPITVTGKSGGANITLEFSTGTVTRVQLERGNQATPYARRGPVEDLALCLRYYRVRQYAARAWAGGAGEILGTDNLDVPMRATPTAVLISSAGSSGPSAITIYANTAQSISIGSTVGGAGFAYTSALYSLSAEL